MTAGYKNISLFVSSFDNDFAFESFPKFRPTIPLDTNSAPVFFMDFGNANIPLSTKVRIGFFIFQVVLDMLIPAFSHKGHKVREEVMTCLTDTINT